jgi:hypothetical protein
MLDDSSRSTWHNTSAESDTTSSKETVTAIAISLSLGVVGILLLALVQWLRQLGTQ